MQLTKSQSDADDTQPDVRQFLPAAACEFVVRLQAKYSSSTFSPSSLTIVPVFATPDPICSICGAPLENADHRGKPAPFGSPVFAKLVQYVRIKSDTPSSRGVAGGRCAP